ncbi:MAG: hypothetical protein AAF596_07385 [Planctomycetota bacterium]
MPSDEQSSTGDLDAAVVRSIAKLTDGRMMSFADQQPPPDAIAEWIAAADLRQTRAVLSLGLRRWHELGGLP